MVDGEPVENGLFPINVGERLRVAREAAGLDLNDVAMRTRVPVRQLAAIERGDYATLPSATYAIGFAKSYARAIGMDEVAIATDLRAELGRAGPGQRESDSYEPADPSRVPPRLLAWTAAALAIALMIAYSIWRSDFFATPQAPPPPAAESSSSPPQAASPRPPSMATTSSEGQVALTATAPVWLQITDSSGTKLLQKEMAIGERYDVPMEAVNPRILTGRPDALAVTIDGRTVAPLGPPERTIRDMDIGAKALAARPIVPATGPVGGPAPQAAQ